MFYARARGRYLAALGLSGAGAALVVAGCHTTETPPPAPSSATPTVTIPAPPASAETTTPAATAQAPKHHTEAWVPAVEPDPKPRPGICPQGPFCLPQPADAGASAAPAPYQMCSATVPLPKGIGPEVTLGKRQPTVAFDEARTKIERAGDPGACCYHWNVLCVGGRALRGPEGPVTAASARRDDWLAPEAAVDATALDPSTRATLAAHWEREAAFEHASVASFARASLALLSVGAPPDLVAATHAAALDEVEHARLAYALASAYGGAKRGPGALPLTAIPATTTLTSLAVETFVDACAGETAAALALREAAERAQDPAVRAVLSRIAGDEERHAELAWRTVAWALHEGGDAVARALREAAARLREEPADDGEAWIDLAAHGVFSLGAQQAIRRRAIDEVVRPCLAALLASAEPC